MQICSSNVINKNVKIRQLSKKILFCLLLLVCMHATNDKKKFLLILAIQFKNTLFETFLLHILLHKHISIVSHDTNFIKYIIILHTFWPWIVSRDFQKLHMILKDRTCFPGIPLDVFNSCFHIVYYKFTALSGPST